MIVFPQYNCPDDEVAAIISIEMTTSSKTLSRTDPEDADQAFQIIVNASIKWSSQPGKPITLNAGGTIFESYDPEAHDAFSRGQISIKRPAGNPSAVQMGLSSWHPGPDPDDIGPDIRERSLTALVTIPAEGRLHVKHAMPWWRVFGSRATRRKQGLAESEVKDGETWIAALRTTSVAAPWWCWGDIEEDLRDKLLLGWTKGLDLQGEKRPTQQQEEAGCVVSEYPGRVRFEYVNKEAQFSIGP